MLDALDDEYRLVHDRDAVHDESLTQFAVRLGASRAELAMLDALVAKTWASSADDLAARDLGQTEHHYVHDADHGADNLRPRQSFKPLLDWYLATLRQRENVVLRVSSRCVGVRFAELRRSGKVWVQVRCERTAKMWTCTADEIVCTLPPPQVVSLRFDPPLPSVLKSAVSNLPLAMALKVVLFFAEPFWPQHHKLILCANAFAPQLWMRTAETSLGNVVHVCTAFVGGDQHHHASMLHSDDQRIRNVLDQLAYMYSRDRASVEQQLIHGVCFDWEEHAFVHMAYTTPGPHAQAHRANLRKAYFHTRLVFAGEATEPGDAGTIHGAMASAERALTLLNTRPKL